MIKKNECKNFNHGRMMVEIQYCPTCGEKFPVNTDNHHCTDTMHAERLKSRHAYCCDCGLSLTPIVKNRSIQSF